MPPRRPHIAVDLALNYSYGRQMAVGLSRFRERRPDWVFINSPRDLGVGVAASGPADGYIGFIGPPQWRWLQETQVLFYINVSNRVDLPGCPKVVADDPAVGHMAAEYFLTGGYRNFAAVEEPDSLFSGQRIAGYRDALAAAGAAPARVLTQADVTAGALADLPRPLAVFAVTDVVALATMNHLAETGIHIPEEVAVLGVNDDEGLAPFAPVPLSSIRLDGERVGYAACELLERMLAGGRLLRETVLVPPVGVVERRSTERLAIDDPRLRRVLAHIEHHYPEPLPVAELARLGHMSRRALEKLFQVELETSPLAWVNRVRMEKAEHLLRQTDHTVERVAELAGFGDRRNLYRAFAAVGKPGPSQIRKGAAGRR